MKIPLKTALGAVAALPILAILLLLYVLIADLSIHKDRILDAASDATGFYIASAGPFDLDVGREIALSAENVTIGNPAWPDEHPLATTASINIVVDTWSVLSGPIEIDSLVISGAHVNLKSSEDGSSNWMPAPASGAEAAPTGPTPDPLIHRVVLDNVRISHEMSGKMLFVSETSMLRLSRTGPNEFDFELDENLDEASLRSTGSLQFAAGMRDITNARIAFDEAVLKLTGPTEISASFSGFAAADLSADRPAIEVDIDVMQLDTASHDKEQPATPDEERGLLFDPAPLAYSWLNSLDLDADISVASASLNGNELSNIIVLARIEDTALAVGPVEFTQGEGRFLGSLELAPANGEYALVLDAQVHNLRLAQLADAEQDPATVPPLNASLRLSGQGASLHDIMASSNGRLSGRQESGQLNLQAMGALFSDFLTSVVSTLNPLAEARTYTNVDCSIFEIDITDGVANIEELALQSDRVTIVSSGDVDFETEALDLTLNTKSREGLGLSVGGVANSFIKLGGTLKEPSLGVDAAGSVTITGAAVATGGLSLLAKSLWDRVSSEVDMCAKEQ